MEIELVTTKRKLTQSIIKQMCHATGTQLNHALCTNGVIGYVFVGGRKYYILKGVNDWYKLAVADWKPVGLYRLSYNTCRKVFTTTEGRDTFLKNYNEIKKLRPIHIYL